MDTPFVWYFGFEQKWVSDYIKDAHRRLNENNRRDAMVAIELAEFHLFRATSMARTEHDQLVLKIYQRDIDTLLYRLGWFWRLLKRYL